MPEWLPKLTIPDLGVLLVTIALCLGASRIFTVGDLVGRLFLGRPPPANEPPSTDDAPEDAP